AVLMSILVVADEFPWPPVNGSRIRVGTQLEGLQQVADVELFCVSDPVPGEVHTVPPGQRITRCELVDRAPTARSGGDVVGWARGRPTSSTNGDGRPSSSGSLPRSRPCSCAASSTGAGSASPTPRSSPTGTPPRPGPGPGPVPPAPTAPRPSCSSWASSPTPRT